MVIHHFLAAMASGFEGREEELGRSVPTVLKKLKNIKPYPHEINDGMIVIATDIKELNLQGLTFCLI